MKKIKSFFLWFVSKRWKRWFFIYLPLLLLCFILICDFAVTRAGKGKLFDHVEDVPEKSIALVFGTSPITAGGENLFYKYRMDAVTTLWNAGKIKHIIVSGDNSRKTYDESTAMKNALIAKGIPDSVITIDYAGFRTLDSVLRCKLVFGQTEVIVVSQEFQNERALFIANHSGINAIGFNAKDVPNRYGFKTMLREYLARVNAVLDIYVLHTQPKFSGPYEPIKI